MLEELLATLNNWFVETSHRGSYVIDGGKFLNFPRAKDGQYFRIKGSTFNDGLHQYPVSNLKDEEFKGTVSLLAVPAEVISLAEEISQWRAENKPSEFTSESFGGYSYSKSTDSSGNAKGWRGAFADRLRRWRKL